MFGIAAAIVRIRGMTTRQTLIAIGGGTIIAAVMVVLAWTLGSSQFRSSEKVSIDFSRDICFSEVPDKLALEDVNAKPEPSPRAEKPEWGANEKEYWVELVRRIEAHNSELNSGGADPQFIFGTGVSFEVKTFPYRGMATGFICPLSDLAACRNRNFWFFKKIPPKQLAEIVFANTVVRNTRIKKCQTD